MAVQIYLGCDLDGQPVEFQHQHEMEGFAKVCKRLWEGLHLAERQYAIIANVRCTGTGRTLSPDLVVVSELGIGVMDLKHYYNQIDCSDPWGAWRAGPIMMNPNRVHSSEKDTAGKYANPHKQVQEYARCIREDLLPSKFQPYISEIQPANTFPKIATAVCFTHPQAILSGCQDIIRMRYRPGGALAEWELFQVLSPAETPEWAMSLRFGMDTGYVGGHVPLNISPVEVDWLARQFFRAVPWGDMINRMHTRPQPYAYLSLIEAGRVVHYYPLLYEEEIVGRDGQACSVVLPGGYTGMSRKHARLLNTEDGFLLEDIGSTNGTFIDGVQVETRVRIGLSEQSLTLGGPAPSKAVPELRFVHRIQTPLPTTS